MVYVSWETGALNKQTLPNTVERSTISLNTPKLNQYWDERFVLLIFPSPFPLDSCQAG